MAKVEIDTAGVTIRVEDSEASAESLSAQALALYRKASEIDQRQSPGPAGGTPGRTARHTHPHRPQLQQQLRLRTNQGRRRRAMTTVDWRPFDYDNRQETAPPKELHDQIVWINEEYYHGVTFGYYDHGGWWCTYWGSDDCHVTHWAPIEYPDAPEVPEEDDDEPEEDFKP